MSNDSGNVSKTLFDYVTGLAHSLESHKSQVLYNILTGKLPPHQGPVDPGYTHCLWVPPNIRKQLSKLAHAEQISLNKLIRDVMTGKRSCLKLEPAPSKPRHRTQATATIPVYKSVADWVATVANKLNISKCVLIDRCLHNRECFTSICEFPARRDSEPYSTLAVYSNIYDAINKRREPGQTLSYTFYSLLEETQKPEPQAKAADIAPQATVGKAEKWTVQSPAQDPAIMLADLRARCRELLLEVMEQEFERIRKTITRI